MVSCVDRMGDTENGIVVDHRFIEHRVVAASKLEEHLGLGQVSQFLELTLDQSTNGTGGLDTGTGAGGDGENSSSQWWNNILSSG